MNNRKQQNLLIKFGPRDIRRDKNGKILGYMVNVQYAQDPSRLKTNPNVYQSKTNKVFYSISQIRQIEKAAGKNMKYYGQEYDEKLGRSFETYTDTSNKADGFVFGVKGDLMENAKADPKKLILNTNSLQSFDGDFENSLYNQKNYTNMAKQLDGYKFSDQENDDMFKDLAHTINKYVPNLDIYSERVDPDAPGRNTYAIRHNGKTFHNVNSRVAGRSLFKSMDKIKPSLPVRIKHGLNTMRKNLNIPEGENYFTDFSFDDIINGLKKAMADELHRANENSKNMVKGVKLGLSSVLDAFKKAKNPSLVLNKQNFNLAYLDKKGYKHLAKNLSVSGLLRLAGENTDRVFGKKLTGFADQLDFMKHVNHIGFKLDPSERQIDIQNLDGPDEQQDQKQGEEQFDK